MLTPEQVAQFREQGFLALPGFASPDEVAALKSRVAELLRDFTPSDHKSVFTTSERQKELTDQYFFNSAGNISYFFEEKAFDDKGELKQAKELSINKIGHALHDLDPVFRRFSRSSKVEGVLRSLGYVRPTPVQSMYIFKQPSIGGEVVPHQDSSYLITQPLSCVGLWWALEDATQDNGCLWAQPGVHKGGLLRKFMRTPEGGITYDKPAPAYDLDKFVPVECPAGTLVLLHGENVHYSCANTSPISRHSYSIHVVEGAPGYTWAPENWAQRPADLPWQPMYDESAQARSGAAATA